MNPIPVRLQQAICTQDFKHEVGGAVALRVKMIDENGIPWMSVNAPAVTAARNIKVYDQDELNYLIIRKLQEMGEHIHEMPINQNEKLTHDQYLMVTINVFANKIAYQTKRRAGNVVIAPKSFLASMEPSLSVGHGKPYEFFEYDNLEPNTFIILARNPINSAYKINADGSPILLMDKDAAEASGFKDMLIGWAWDDLVTQYVKIIHYKSGK